MIAEQSACSNSSYARVRSARLSKPRTWIKAWTLLSEWPTRPLTKALAPERTYGCSKEVRRALGCYTCSILLNNRAKPNRWFRRLCSITCWASYTLWPPTCSWSAEASDQVCAWIQRAKVRFGFSYLRVRANFRVLSFAEQEAEHAKVTQRLLRHLKICFTK